MPSIDVCALNEPQTTMHAFQCTHARTIRTVKAVAVSAIVELFAFPGLATAVAFVPIAAGVVVLRAHTTTNATPTNDSLTASNRLVPRPNTRRD